MEKLIIKGISQVERQKWIKNKIKTIVCEILKQNLTSAKTEYGNGIHEHKRWIFFFFSKKWTKKKDTKNKTECERGGAWSNIITNCTWSPEEEEKENGAQKIFRDNNWKHFKIEIWKLPTHRSKKLENLCWN